MGFGAPMAHALGVGGLCAVLLLVVWLLWSNRTYRRRRRRLAEVGGVSAVQTDPSSEEARLPDARGRTLEETETRHRTLRRLLLPFCATVIGLLSALPFAGELPGATATVIVAGLTVVVGVASKAVFENAIAGVVITFAQPIRIGDVVQIDGYFGVVEDITLTRTQIKVWDWRRYLVPNQRMLHETLVNLSIVDKWRWTYVEFVVAHDADLDLVERIAVQAVRETEHHREEGGPPRFWVMEMTEIGVRCWAAGWIDDPTNSWTFYHQLRTNIFRLLQRHRVPTHAYRHFLGDASGGMRGREPCRRGDQGPEPPLAACLEDTYGALRGHPGERSGLDVPPVPAEGASGLSPRQASNQTIESVRRT